MLVLEEGMNKLQHWESVSCSTSDSGLTSAKPFALFVLKSSRRCNRED